jgi:long-chain acyl-CoA synthetase
MKKNKMLLAEIFDGNAVRLSSKLAVREKERDWSYSELLSRSEGLSDSLASLGVSEGHRVAILMPNSGSFVASFFGIARLRGAIAPLNIRFRTQELLYYMRDILPTALLVDSNHFANVEEALGELKSKPSLVEVQPDGYFKIRQKGETAKTLSSKSNDPALLLQYTSGSTGNPKRVIRTQGQLISELERLASVFNLGKSDKFLGAAPFSHVNGLVRTMMTSMFVGGTLYPEPKFKRREVLKIITQEKISYFGGVPYMFVILAATPKRGKVDLSSLRTAFSSSAPLLPDDNKQFANKYGFFIRQLYGSTETGTISVNADSKLDDSLESVGLPLKDIIIEILDNKGKALPAGQEGEVAISSPFAITAYENNPDANAESFRNGFYLSGDLGVKDNRGHLTLTGRKKFLINRGGYEVNPFEVEQAIKSYPKVEEVVVLGAESRHGDQLVRCVIVGNSPCKEDEIINHCKSRIADYKIPSIVEFVKELPKSQTGKILRQKLE